MRGEAIHSRLGPPVCYLGAQGLAGPQVQAAGRHAAPAARACGQGEGEGLSEPGTGSLKQLGEGGGTREVQKLLETAWRQHQN